jgi:hypothetical protein
MAAARREAVLNIMGGGPGWDARGIGRTGIARSAPSVPGRDEAADHLNLPH